LLINLKRVTARLPSFYSLLPRNVTKKGALRC
jgi:hypothetical protein